MATLISKRSTDNSTIFVIDDGTGRIDAFRWNLPNPALEMATIGEIQQVYHSPLHISTHLPFFFFSEKESMSEPREKSRSTITDDDVCNCRIFGCPATRTSCTIISQM